LRRCEVWWAELPPPAGRRPVVLLSRDEAYAVRSQVTVAPVTTRSRGIPVEVDLGPDDGLPRQCVANLDSMVTIPKAHLTERIGLLRPEKIARIEAAIRFALGLSE
jgi:mRNA interferase MazF